MLTKALSKCCEQNMGTKIVNKKCELNLGTRALNKSFEQAGAELGQAQVKLDDIVVIVVEVVVKAMVEVEFNYYSGWVVG